MMGPKATKINEKSPAQADVRHETGEEVFLLLLFFIWNEKEAMMQIWIILWGERLRFKRIYAWECLPAL